ncbi:vitrin [Anaeramoeba flamelloides]|uniref:Vitrin n=1 Tax=Anaeramoeba flamelloides TaxID=1746091 RepID=A0ABQ8Y9T4_9EUKA|nr:vitrin [Anaeramoeba flamelloides]
MNQQEVMKQRMNDLLNEKEKMQRQCKSLQIAIEELQKGLEVSKQRELNHQSNYEDLELRYYDLVNKSEKKEEIIGEADLLDPKFIKEIQPGEIRNLCSLPNKRYKVRLTGVTSGTVYGSAFYTDDSCMHTAAVHSGKLKTGETKVLFLETKGSRSSYKGTSQNGVTTRDWNSAWNCFQFL